jgi:hypothetical protein
MTEPLRRDVFAVCTRSKTRQKMKAKSTRNFSVRGNISRYFFAVFLTDLHGKHLCRVLFSNTRQRMNSGSAPKFPLFYLLCNIRGRNTAKNEGHVDEKLFHAWEYFPLFLCRVLNGLTWQKPLPCSFQ